MRIVGENAGSASHRRIRQTHPTLANRPRPLARTTRRTYRLSPHLHRHDRTRRAQPLALEHRRVREGVRDVGFGAYEILIIDLAEVDRNEYLVCLSG